MERSEFRVLIKRYFLCGKTLSETKDKLDVVYFVLSAERRILMQDRVAPRFLVLSRPKSRLARAFKYVPHVIRTIFFVRCIPKVSKSVKFYRTSVGKSTFRTQNDTRQG